MKKTSKGFPILSFVILLALCACSKGFSGGTPTPPAEDKLEVKLSAATIETALSNSYTFTVNIQSKLPANGVTIKVDVKREDNAASVYNVQASSNFSSNSFTINPLPSGQIYCAATITITSVNTPTNIWTGTFRVLWK